ncbi:MAG: hypothetical protein A2293_02320 [Elusimicrobia bacterium RIFOXYB2_FULL_49_7]|nr:MAG: hypothetical protein A2293_02320 [Elusimicrobia bacterium RIFOXYB2_FULL_49_7]
MNDLFENLIFKKEDIIQFPDGIPGFEHHKQFVLVEVPEHEPFQWLVCVTDINLRFAVINPMIIRPDYNPPVSKTQLESLEFSNPEEVMILVIITLHKNLAESTANFMGPIFLNRKKNRGKQIVLDSDTYSVQEPVIRS